MNYFNALLELTWGTMEAPENSASYLINHAFQFVISTTECPIRAGYRTFTEFNAEYIWNHIQEKLGHENINSGWDLAQPEMSRVLRKMFANVESFKNFRRELSFVSEGFKKPVDVRPLLLKHGGQYLLNTTRFIASEVRPLTTSEERVETFLSKLSPDMRAKYFKQPIDTLRSRY